MGCPAVWLGPIFLFSTVMMYAGIGIYGRTTDADEYYVAGRRIPPMYNGMAAAADWMSAASFISLAGGLYLAGLWWHRVRSRAGWPMCWAGRAASAWWRCWWPHICASWGCTPCRITSGALWRRWPRLIAALAAVLCSFTYVVAQIYGMA
jgi:cation/acetate symporter